MGRLLACFRYCLVGDMIFLGVSYISLHCESVTRIIVFSSGFVAILQRKYRSSDTKQSEDFTPRCCSTVCLLSIGIFLSRCSIIVINRAAAAARRSRVVLLGANPARNLRPLFWRMPTYMCVR